jgi:hypothetical protein
MGLATAQRELRPDCCPIDTGRPLAIANFVLVYGDQRDLAQMAVA